MAACTALSSCSSASWWRKGRTGFGGVSSQCWLSSTCNFKSTLCCTEGFTTFFPGEAADKLPTKEQIESIERGLSLARNQYALLPDSIEWHESACPFEETRHNCFFFRQDDAVEVAQRSAKLMPTMTNASVPNFIRAYRGRTIAFVGDSVVRQLAEAFMCRLRRHLHSEQGIVWIDPTARKEPSLDYRGMCPLGKKHCELRHGCAAFGPNERDTGSSSKSGLTAAEATTKVCGLFDAKFHGAGGGWQLLRNVLNSSKLPSTTSALIFSSGHHVSGEALKTHWTDVASRDAAFAVARKQGVRLILQEHEQQHFSHGGEYNATLHGIRQSIHTLNTRQAIRHSRCEMLPESAVSPRYELEKQHVIPHLLANGFEVLPTHAISRAAWFGHTHAAPTPSGATDCTHFCMPGIPDIWAAILLEKLSGSA